MQCDYLIVGAGPAGAVLAERLASQNNAKCLVVEKRRFVGGNLHDGYNQHGIMVHTFGPHFFRTDNERVWDYLSRFTEWHWYQHRVMSNVKGMLVPFPINLDTYNLLNNTTLTQEEFRRQLEKFHRTDNPRNVEESIINQVGQYLYETFFKNYTIKQWGKHPRDLHPDTTRRVGVRLDRESRYQLLKYQALPKRGYTAMIDNLLAHPNIRILLQTDYKQVIDQIRYKQMIYTGPLDYFFDYRFGPLEYRSLRLEEETFFQESYQSCAVINYPNNYAYTRITEYKKMTGQRHHFTTVHFEYPQPYERGTNEPYYPILDKHNLELRERYLQESRTLPKVIFFGRLAEYRYYAMDEVVEGALQLHKKLSAP